MVRSLRAAAYVAAMLFVVPRSVAQPVPDHTLGATDAHASQRFGSAVAIEGPVAVVGADGDDPEFSTLQYGAAYVLRYDGAVWVEEQKLTRAERQMQGLFGQSVDVATHDETTWIFVGMLQDAGVPSGNGAVSVYRHDGSSWVEEDLLTASDGEAGDNFGYSMAIVDAGDYTVWRDAVIAAPRHNLLPFNREGAAYVFRHEDGAWSEVAKITASDPATSANFGASVAISDERILIGADGVDIEGAGTRSGAAYVFEREGADWVETAKLEPSDPVSLGQFGISVAIEGDWALVGARGSQDPPNGAGAVYAFFHNGDEWVEVQKLMAPDPASLSYFGQAIALDGTEAVIGSPFWAAPNGDATGKAYRYTYSEADAAWIHVEDLLAEGLGGGDKYGERVALDAGVALVGTTDFSGLAPGAGAVYAFGDPTPTASEPTVPSARLAAQIHSYPNPMRDQATISYRTERAGPISIVVYDLLGRRVRTLVDANRPSETAQITWDGRDDRGTHLPSGTYFARLHTGNSVRTNTLLVVR